MDSPALLSPCPANLNTQLLTHRIKTPLAHVFIAVSAIEYIANLVLVVKNKVYRAGIRVKVLDFVTHANQLAAAFVFPPLPAHAQLSVFNAPLPRITAAVVAIHRAVAVAFELQPRRAAGQACSRKAFAQPERLRSLLKLSSMRKACRCCAALAKTPCLPYTFHMPTEALSVAFRADSITTASKATLQRMAKTLGFTQNQTVLYALARLRDELQAAQVTAPTPAAKDSSTPSYPPLTTAQHQIIRQHATKRRAKPVRSSSITDLL